MWLGRIKRSVGIEQEISAQLEAEELRQTLNEQKKQLDETLHMPAMRRVKRHHHHAFLARVTGGCQRLACRRQCSLDDGDDLRRARDLRHPYQ